MRLFTLFVLVQVVCGVKGGAGGRALAGGPATMLMPQLVSLDVKCGRSGMSVHLVFDQPFPGIIYSKGHFYDSSCNYVTLDDSGKKDFKFNVPIDRCGTTGQLEAATRSRDMFFENTIIIQNDPVIQEEWDIARNLRCIWQHTIQKSVDFTPFKVYEPRKVSVQLDKRSVNTLMEIQEGAGPFAGPATGYVYMGEDISVVMYVQDPQHEMDANVVSCNASSAGGTQVNLLDSRGCLLRPDLLTPFAKTRNTNGVEADLMLYSYLKAFKIGESPEFLIKCHLEVCEGSCSEPSCGSGPARRKREDREAARMSTLVPLQQEVMVVSRVPPYGGELCVVTSPMVVGAAGLVCLLVVLLSLLSCGLFHQLTSLRRQLHLKSAQ